MKQLTTAARAALTTSHTVAASCVASIGNVAQGRLDVIDGSVDLDEQSDVRGRCDLTFAPADRPIGLDASDLDVSGWRLDLGYIIRLSTGDVTIPLGVFVIYDVTETDGPSGRTIQVSGLDVSALVRDARFEVPYSVAAGTNYATAISTMIEAVGVSTQMPTTGYTTPLLVFEDGSDRWAAAKQMAASIGWELLADTTGTIIGRTVPGATAVPVWDFVEGEGSLMTELSRKRSRDGVYNIAIVTGEPAGNTAPVTGAAYDDDPSSPTYYLGPFGRVPVFQRSQFVTTTAQAVDAAAGLLNSKKGIGVALNVSAVPNPALEPGDPVRVMRTRLGVDAVIPIRSVSLPLSPGEPMTVVTRELNA